MMMPAMTSDKEEKRYKLNRLKEAVDAEQLLKHLGFEVSLSNSTEVRAPCKVHGGDNKTAFRMNKETKNWVCFSHNCQEDVGYDVISLIMKILNISFPQAVQYLESITGLDVKDDAAYVNYKRDRDRREFITQMKPRQDQVPAKYVSEEHLRVFKKFRSNFFNRRENGSFPNEVLDFFEIGGGYVDKYGHQRDVIPIRDEKGILKACSFRDITERTSEDYKYILSDGFQKDKILYNLDKAKDYMGENRELIVVEGFKSVWKLYMAGYKNVVACIGSRITPGQQKLLYSHAFNVFLLLDGDAAGIKGMSKAVQDMKGKINLHPIILPWDNRDPADLSVEELKMLLGGV